MASARNEPGPDGPAQDGSPALTVFLSQCFHSLPVDIQRRRHLFNRLPRVPGPRTPRQTKAYCKLLKSTLTQASAFSSSSASVFMSSATVASNCTALQAMQAVHEPPEGDDAPAADPAFYQTVLSTLRRWADECLGSRALPPDAEEPPAPAGPQDPDALPWGTHSGELFAYLMRMTRQVVEAVGPGPDADDYSEAAVAADQQPGVSSSCEGVSGAARAEGAEDDDSSSLTASDLESDPDSDQDDDDDDDYDGDASHRSMVALWRTERLVEKAVNRQRRAVCTPGASTWTSKDYLAFYCICSALHRRRCHLADPHYSYDLCHLDALAANVLSLSEGLAPPFPRVLPPTLDPGAVHRQPYTAAEVAALSWRLSATVSGYAPGIWPSIQPVLAAIARRVPRGHASPLRPRFGPRSQAPVVPRPGNNGVEFVTSTPRRTSRPRPSSSSSAGQQP